MLLLFFRESNWDLKKQSDLTKALQVGFHTMYVTSVCTKDIAWKIPVMYNFSCSPNVEAANIF